MDPTPNDWDICVAVPFTNEYKVSRLLPAKLEQPYPDQSLFEEPEPLANGPQYVPLAWFCDVARMLLFESEVGWNTTVAELASPPKTNTPLPVDHPGDPELPHSVHPYADSDCDDPAQPSSVIDVVGFSGVSFRQRAVFGRRVCQSIPSRSASDCNALRCIPSGSRPASTSSKIASRSLRTSTACRSLSVCDRDRP